MVHLPPLPGTVGYTGYSTQEIVDFALRDVWFHSVDSCVQGLIVDLIRVEYENAVAIEDDASRTQDHFPASHVGVRSAALVVHREIENRVF